MGRLRRGRGENGIYQRASDKLWVGSFSLGYDGSGKRKRRVVYGKTKREVQQKIDRLRVEGPIGRTTDAAAMTFGTYLERWLEAGRANAAARTQEERERLVRVHLRPRLGGLRLDRLTALHVEGLYADLRRDGVGPFAVRSAADLLGASLNHAVRLKLIPANPAAAVPKPRTPKREMRCLDEPQARVVLGATDGAAVGPLVAVALATGCRQGELLALGWEDIDLAAGTLTVRRSLAQTKAGFVVKEPKTAASRRTLSLPAFAVEVLAALRRDRGAGGLAAAPVFCTRTGGYLCKKNVLRAFRGVLRKANAAIRAAGAGVPIPDTLRFHDLRHSVASILLSKGHSVRAVSQRLGHANPTMTLRVYAHCMPTDDGRLADGLNAAFTTTPAA
jgi:integrase